MASKPKNLRVCGLSVPFDGAARFAEMEAYDTALREGGSVFSLVRHMAPVIVNARLRPAVEFQLEPHTPVDEDTSLAILTVAEAIREALNGPKVKAALEKTNGTATPSR